MADTLADPVTGTAPEGASRKLVLIDGNSLLYRGFFAMRALTTSAGQPTNAVYSFTMMLLTLLEKEKPDVMVSAWDTSENTFRHDAYAEYKGTRKATPPELVEQGPLARELVEAFGVPMIEAPGFEADDIIGTLARRGVRQGYEVLIVTGDLDALQLVEPGVRVMTTIKGVTDTVVYDEAAVESRYGLRPDQLIDFKALKGDASDNIPGVAGIGDKTAAKLLQQYGTLEGILEHIDEIKETRTKTALTGAGNQAELSKHLGTIIRDVPLEGIDLPALDAEPVRPDWDRVRALFERLEFRTLQRRLPGGGAEKKPDATPAATAPAAGAPVDLFSAAEEPESAPPPEAPPADYREVAEGDFADLTRAVRAAHRVGLRLHVTDGVLDSRLLGVALATGGGTVFYVPVDEGAPEEAAPAVVPSASLSLFDDPAPAQPPAGQPVPSPEPVALPDELRAILEDEKVAKATHQAKADFAVLARCGVQLRGVVFDTELAAYLLNAGRRAGFPLSEVASDYAGRELAPLDPKVRKTMDAAAIRAHEKQQAFAEAEAVLAVMGVQEPRLSADGLTRVLEELELPVTPILAQMELIGVAVDVTVLKRLADEMQARIEGLQRDIYEMAGAQFNIGSPKQLQEVLFEKMKLPSGKKTKTGYSTGADVLEELAVQYPIVSKILHYRELTKLKGTYADALPLLVRPDTGRIHTSLNQTVAATGRLSSSNPNLQNIPIRTEVGREIRKAFVAGDGCVLLSADYSQIELRIFAHVSRDPELMSAFASGEDIHVYTASRVYGVPVDEVTKDMRRAAKTVNYAVIYGISEFALARQLGIPMAVAKELKTSYFARFPGVKEYIDQTVAFAREKGYVQTLMGRRRHMPDINSRVFQFRQAAERAAANMPIQGSAADIMKLAMIRAWEMLSREKLRAKMLLQVHDELLFETPEEEVPALAAHVRDCMENAYPVDVRLEVEVKTGRTWADVTPVEDTTALPVME